MSSPQAKEKRGIVSGRRRRLLYLYVASLQLLQVKFPELRQDIQEDIDRSLSQAERTRAADRGDVLRVLDEWRTVGLIASELANDTGLSDRTVRGALDEMLQMDPPLVRFIERVQDRERGRRARIFFPS